MKTCEKCGLENADTMNFCVECGSALSKDVEKVVPLETIAMHNTVDLSNQKTEAFEQETIQKTQSFGQETIQKTQSFGQETVADNRFNFQQESIPTFQAKTPQESNSKMFLAIGGGLLGLFLLVFTGIAGIALYAWLPQPQPKPLVSNPKKTPTTNETPETSSETFPEETPEKTPDVTPEETPEPTPLSTPDENNQVITFPAPTVPTQRGTFEVETVTGWQLSEIKTVSSQNFRVQASGRINLDGIKGNVSPKGVSGYENRRIIPEFRTGALLMRTHYPDGSHSIIQAVSAGEYWLNEPGETGKIEFLVNDNSPGSNSGSFAVTVTNMGFNE